VPVALRRRGRPIIAWATLAVGLLVADDAAFGSAECAPDNSAAWTAQNSTDDCTADSTDCAVLLTEWCGTAANRGGHSHKQENDFGTHLLLQKKNWPDSEMLPSFHAELTANT
jgi:hypothetical protein